MLFDQDMLREYTESEDFYPDRWTNENPARLPAYAQSEAGAGVSMPWPPETGDTVGPLTATVNSAGVLTVGHSPVTSGTTSAEPPNTPSLLIPILLVVAAIMFWPGK